VEENLYFAYGSNLDLEQMAQRCPDAEIVGPVRLENYELRFRGSGFATVAPKKGSVVYGLVWKITPNCEQSLDRYEEFPIVKDTTPNMMNPRLYTTSYNKPQGQQFDDTAVLSFIKLQYT
jgi:hypothetical protein